MINKIKKNLIFRFRKWADIRLEPAIVAYRGYGNQKYVLIQGHVIKKSGIAAPDESHSKFKNMISMLKRYFFREIPDQQVKAKFAGQEHETRTDKSGHFEFEFHLDHALIPQKNQNWYPVDLELPVPLNQDTDTNHVRGEVLIPDTSTCQYGVISDIDDTVLVSHANNAFKKLRLMLIKNAHTRHPFKGVVAFYNALHYGASKNNNNPFFYVSSSEWNLYDLLVDFCNIQDIPKGPLLLKSLKTRLLKIPKAIIRNNKARPLSNNIKKGFIKHLKHKIFFLKKTNNHNHKLNKIRHILQTYKNLKFILIGDSGQKDPKIYTQIVREFPNQILTVYIREMHKKKHSYQMNMLIGEMARNGVEMLLLQDTEKAAIHAAKMGYIHNDFLIDIKSDIYKDESAPGELEAILQ